MFYVVLFCSIVLSASLCVVLMMKRRKRSENDASSAPQPSERAWKNMHDIYQCGHVGCFCAPNADVYKQDSRKLQWLKSHERAHIGGHHEQCMKHACPRCIELWGHSLGDATRLKRLNHLPDAYDEVKANAAAASGRAGVARESLESPLLLRSSFSTSSASSPSASSVSTPRTRRSTMRASLSQASEVGASATPKKGNSVDVCAALSAVTTAATAAAVSAALQHAKENMARTNAQSPASGVLYEQLSVAHKVLHDIVSFIAAFPKQSAHRWAFVAAMGKTVGARTLHCLLHDLGFDETPTGFGESSIRASVKRLHDEGAPTLLLAKRTPGLNRAHWPANTYDEAEMVWYELSDQTHRRAADGCTRLEQYWLRVPLDHVFLHYREKMLLHHFGIEANRYGDCTASFGGDFRRLNKQKAAMSRSTFLRTKPHNVQQRRLYEHACKTCRRAYLVLDTVEAENRQPNEDEEEILNDRSRHFEAAVAQKERFKQERTTLASGEALLVMDFSPWRGAMRRTSTMDEQMAGKVQALHVAVYVGDAGDSENNVDDGAVGTSSGQSSEQSSEENSEQTSENSNDSALSASDESSSAGERDTFECDTYKLRFYSYFSHENNDKHFVRRALLHLWQREELKSLHLKAIWSDGGPKHFKLKATLGVVLVELALSYGWDKSPTWNFFVAGHGKNICDGLKAILLADSKRGARRGESIVGARGYVHYFNKRKPLSEDSRRALYRRKPISTHHALLIEVLKRDQEWQWEGIDAVRRYHSWRWTGTERQKKGSAHSTRMEYEIEARILTGDEHRNTFWISADYDVESRMDGTEMDAALVKKQTKLKSAKAKGLATANWQLLEKNKGKRARTSTANSSDNSEESDDERIVFNDYVYIDEDDTLEESNYKLYTVNKRVAVRFDVEGPLARKVRSAWFTGVVSKRPKPVAICKKIGREQFVLLLHVIFDGAAEDINGEIVEFDENVRLLKPT